MRVGALYAILRLETGAFHSALGRAESRWKRFGGFLKAGGLIAAQALLVVGGASMKFASDFEQHMNEALAIMDGVTGEMRSKMEEAARAIAKTSTFSATEAADAFFYLAGAGLNAEQSIAALPVVTQFAQAGVMSLEEATEKLMNAQSAMNMKSDDVAENQKNLQRVSDVLSAAQIRSTATLDQMADALLNKAAPALRVVGKDIEEGAAVLAVFADQGLKGQKAGTALGIVLRELQTKAIKNKEEWKALGVTVFDSNGEMRHMADIMADLEKATAGMSDEQIRATFTTLGFTDRSLGFIQTLMGTSDAIRDYDTELRNAAGTTKTIAEKQLDTFNAQLEITWHKIQDVGISIGNALLPGARGMVEAIGDWVDENHELITTIAVGVFEGIKRVLGVLGDLIGLIVEGASVVADVLAPAFAAVGDAVSPIIDWIKEIVTGLGSLDEHAGDDSPLGAIGGVVEAVGEQFRWFTEEILPPFVEFFTAVGEIVVPKVMEVFQFVADNVFPAFGAAIDWISTNVLPLFRAAFEGIAAWFEENMPGLLEIVTMAMEGIGTVFTVAWNVAKTVVETVVPIIWGIIEPLATFLFPLIGAAAGVMVEVIRVVMETLGKIWQQVADSAEVVADAIGDAFRWLGAFFSGLWDGITATFKGAVNFIIDLINGFLGILNNIRVDIPRVNIPGTDIGVGGGAIDPFDIGYIPRLARGTRSFGGGLAWVGEFGPELVNLPGGSSVVPSPFAVGGAGTMGTQVIQLVVDGKILAQTVRRQEYYGSGSSSRLPRS